MATKKKAAKKKAAKKKTPAKRSIDLSFLKQRVVEELDWDKIPDGTIIKVYDIDAKKSVTGRVFRDDDKEIVICHNSPSFDFGENDVVPGYKYSIPLKKGTFFDFKEWDLEAMEIKLDPTYKTPKIVKIDDDTVVFGKGKIKVGCTNVSNAIVREVAANLID